MHDRLGIAAIFATILTEPLQQYGVVVNELSPPLQMLISVVDQRVDDIIPEGSVVVDRARFERLRQAAEWWEDHIRHNGGETFLEPTDTDPLP